LRRREHPLTALEEPRWQSVWVKRVDRSLALPGDAVLVSDAAGTTRVPVAAENCAL
jgi:hypothetical protein